MCAIVFTIWIHKTDESSSWITIYDSEFHFKISTIPVPYAVSTVFTEFRPPKYHYVILVSLNQQPESNPIPIEKKEEEKKNQISVKRQLFEITKSKIESEHKNTSLNESQWLLLLLLLFVCATSDTSGQTLNEKMKCDNK